MFMFRKYFLLFLKCVVLALGADLHLKPHRLISVAKLIFLYDGDDSWLYHSILISDFNYTSALFVFHIVPFSCSRTIYLLTFIAMFLSFSKFMIVGVNKKIMKEIKWIQYTVPRLRNILLLFILHTHTKLGLAKYATAKHVK